jgi:hypothetical protein
MRTPPTTAASSVSTPSLVTEPAAQETDLYDQLMALSDDPDVRHIVTTADQNGTWAKTRTTLLAEGWDPLRVRAAIKKTRALVSQYLCLDES